MESIYANTLRNLSDTFKEGLNHNDNFNAETIIRATAFLMTKISNMPFDEGYKKALGDACIEAASLIDLELYTDKEATVNAFNSNLDNELTNLLRTVSPSRR